MLVAPDAGAAGAHHHPGAARARRRARLPAAAARPRDAVELFRERATAARPGVRLTTSGWRRSSTASTGCRSRSSWPRRRVRVMSVEEIDRRLETGSRCCAAATGRHPSGTRRCWRSSTGPGTCSTPTSSARCAGCRCSATASRSTARRRCSASTTRSTWSPRWSTSRWSTVLEAARRVRYRLLETVREFGRMQLVDAGDDARGASGCCAPGRSRFAERRRAAGCSPRTRSTRSTGSGPRRATSPTCCAAASPTRDAAAVVPVLVAALGGCWTIEGNHAQGRHRRGGRRGRGRGWTPPPELEDAAARRRSRC